MQSDNKEIIRLLRKLVEEGVKVAESPEVAAFREVVAKSLDNISNDIKTLLGRNPGLSEEDKEALKAVAENISAVADIVPE